MTLMLYACPGCGQVDAGWVEENEWAGWSDCSNLLVDDNGTITPTPTGNTEYEGVILVHGWHCNKCGYVRNA